MAECSYETALKHRQAVAHRRFFGKQLAMSALALSSPRNRSIRFKWREKSREAIGLSFVTSFMSFFYSLLSSIIEGCHTITEAFHS